MDSRSFKLTIFNSAQRILTCLTLNNALFVMQFLNPWRERPQAFARCSFFFPLSAIFCSSISVFVTMSSPFHFVFVFAVLFDSFCESQLHYTIRVDFCQQVFRNFPKNIDFCESMLYNNEERTVQQYGNWRKNTHQANAA